MVIRFNAAWPITSAKRRGTTRSDLRELKDGGVELRLKLSSLAEVERWVLSWGGDAVVVKPVELIHSIRAAARKLLAATRSSR